MGITLCGHFKEVGAALVDLENCKDASKVVAQCVPLVGVGFMLLKPILDAFVNFGEVAELVLVTLNRISRLANTSLTSKLRRLRKSGNQDNTALGKEIKPIAALLNLGCDATRLNVPCCIIAIVHLLLVSRTSGGAC